VALDLEPETVYEQALRIVHRAGRKLWLLRLKMFLLHATPW
jgi:hypothetical protein